MGITIVRSSEKVKERVEFCYFHQETDIGVNTVLHYHAAAIQSDYNIEYSSNLQCCRHSNCDSYALLHLYVAEA